MIKTCTICRSATLVHRQNLRTLAVMAGVADVLLRQHVERQQEQPAEPAPWRQLGELVALLQAPATTIETGVEQGVALADIAARHWLGTFDSLCLNCGFLLMDETGQEPPTPSERSD